MNKEKNILKDRKIRTEKSVQKGGERRKETLIGWRIQNKLAKIPKINSGKNGRWTFDLRRAKKDAGWSANI